jgi:hypothetical protein
MTSEQIRDLVKKTDIPKLTDRLEELSEPDVKPDQQRETRDSSIFDD